MKVCKIMKNGSFFLGRCVADARQLKAKTYRDDHVQLVVITCQKCAAMIRLE